jgi:hypothetical protein
VGFMVNFSGRTTYLSYRPTSDFKSRRSRVKLEMGSVCFFYSKSPFYTNVSECGLSGLQGKSV